MKIETVNIDDEIGKHEVGRLIRQNVDEGDWGIKEVVLFTKKLFELFEDGEHITYRNIYESLGWECPPKLELFPEQLAADFIFSNEDEEKFPELADELLKAMSDYDEWIIRIIHEAISDGSEAIKNELKILLG
jgi:hypothetical protein